jgi:phosphoglycerate dehydrogenase-like enzyme
MKPKYRILFLGPDHAFQDLATSVAIDYQLEHAEIDDRAAFQRQLASSDGMVDASMAVPIDDDLIESSRNLKIISTATTGSSHIRLNQKNLERITIRTLREDADLLKDLTPAAEHTWGLVMSLSRDFCGASKHTQNGRWVRELFPSILLKDKTYGIIGLGRIGGWVSRYALAFGMKVIAYDPWISHWPSQVEKVDNLLDIAKSSDFFSLHVHLSDDTHNLLGKEFFQKLKVGSIFVNTSRGELTDESALLDSLNNKQLGGAGLDVLTNEPNISNDPLIKYSTRHSNLIITPHCGGYSPDAVCLVSKRALDKTLNFLRGTPYL